MPLRWLTRLSETREVFVRVASDRRLLRVEAAFAAFNVAEWSTWVAILVFAYRDGGPTRVGLVALGLLIPGAVVALFGSVVGDRTSRARFLALGYGCQSISMSLTALAMFSHVSSFMVYIPAALATAAVALTRPAQSALLPSLTADVNELTAANVFSGIVENASVLAGPLLTGVILATAGPATAWAAMGVLMALAAAAVATLNERSAVSAHDEEAGSDEGTLSALFAGAHDAITMPRPRTVVALMALDYVVLGTLEVFVVVLAIDVLRVGQPAVGYLTATLGAGGLVGAAVSGLLVGHRRLSWPFQAGIAMMALCVAGIGAAPVLVAAVLMLAGVGAGRNVMDVSGRTLLQRLVPDQTLARLFGFLESLYNALLGLGALLATPMVSALGGRSAMIAVGCCASVLVLIPSHALRRLDSLGAPDELRVEALARVSMFSLLPPYVVERVAGQMLDVVARSGTAVVRAGNRDRHFFVIAAGHADVLVDGIRIRTLGPGDTFGEVAAWSGRARTATVRATTDMKLFRLDHRLFIETISHQGASRRALDAMISETLAADAERRGSARGD